ncbi:MAG TPA: aspartate kinase [Balneolaceae bacterium]|nr:aspartate kinase [Balneolaceae bacterium]
MLTTETHILKFGGTSLQNSAFIKQSAQIVAERAETVRTLVVVSAIAGATDALIEITNYLDKATQLITILEQQHDEIVCEFISRSNGQKIALQRLFGELRQVIQNHSLREENFGAWKDHILSIGERASALIFSAALAEHHISSKPFEAYRFIKTDSNFGEAGVKSDQSRRLIQKEFHALKGIPVITGFIGSDDEDRITTLGRSGSDYTAGLIADALNATHLEIWTDVNGVLTADPKWVPTAEPIDALSFDDIEELSAHGANVIHPKTIRPIRGKVTSVLVKNSYNPPHAGTLITRDFSSNGALKTITVTGPFAWLRVDDCYAYPLFNKLKALSKDPDTFTFKRGSTFEPARFLIDQSFFLKIQEQLKKWADKFDINPKLDIYKVKKFSNHFAKSEQLTSSICNLLASNKIQPLHIERNRDERFISFLFEKKEARRTARLLNDYLHHDKRVVNLFIAGSGAIGKTLLQQLRKIKPKNTELRLMGICNSRDFLWDDNGIDLQQNISWKEAQTTSRNLLLKKLTQPFLHNLIFVDATGSPEVARLYLQLFGSSVHVVTPSKLANTFEQSFFDELRAEAINNNVSFRYETTVGAGLPVISTIKDLQDSGDEITEISGVVSGTMTYLFNQVEQGVPFSKAVLKARELGYAEPDPRDDLSGEDVARKFLTIARTMGLKIERDELKVESLIPDELLDIDRTTFLTRLAEYDSAWKERILKARERNETLRYVGQLKDGKVSVGTQPVPVHSPMGQLKSTDNIIQISSRFYNQTPLVIQGPGAGKEVTAAGVLVDILKMVEKL